MRATQSELLKVVNSEVSMHINEAGFYHRYVTASAIVVALTRLGGRAPWRNVTELAAMALQISPRLLFATCDDGRTLWQRECSFAYSDVLVKQGVCLPYETTGKGIWQFVTRLAIEIPDYSELRK